MKKIIAIIVVLSLLLTFSSCDEYVSSYKALMLVRSNTSHSCNVSFSSLDGSLVFKLKKSDIGEGNISFSINVEEGELYLYYDAYGIKEELAHVEDGESLTDVGGYVEGGDKIYIIIEAKKCKKGKISVELDG